jgi:hypothetical protein
MHSMSPSIIEATVSRQLAAMHCTLFDLGALSQSGGVILSQNCAARLIQIALRWLQRENAHGAHVFIRPAGRHQLSLVDDLTADAVADMKRAGFEPAIVVETSPANFQAWLKHGRILDQRASTSAAKELAHRFGGDLSSADWRHFGRLAGFTNQKEKRRLPNGLAPFVKLREASGRTYQKANEFLQGITVLVERDLAEAANRKRPAAFSDIAIKPPSAFHADPRYEGDLHCADLAWAIYAASRGFSEEQITDQILYARDLSKKGRQNRQLDYAKRTATKAITVVHSTR